MCKIPSLRLRDKRVLFKNSSRLQSSFGIVPLLSLSLSFGCQQGRQGEREASSLFPLTRPEDLDGIRTR